MSNEITGNDKNIPTVADTNFPILPRNLDAQINQAIQMRESLDTLFQKLLVQGVDYDRITGTDRPTLLKPGAEMLCKVFNLAPGKMEVLDKETDWEKGIFSYTVGMPLIHISSGATVAYGIGAATSYEKKYRYRRDKNTGTLIENNDPADNMNTLIKMAGKRAFVDAVLKATGASRKFTQDMEDFGTGQFETASTKQIDYIKKLFGNVPEAQVMGEISQIIGREVANYRDIYRSEASKIIDAKNKPANYANQSSQQKHFCSDCGASITNAENNYSIKRYDRPLCRKCQSMVNAAFNTALIDSMQESAKPANATQPATEPETATDLYSDFSEDDLPF